jgi:hypothetical protein
VEHGDLHAVACVAAVPEQNEAAVAVLAPTVAFCFVSIQSPDINSACRFLPQIKSVCWREGMCALVVGGACVHCSLFIGFPFSVPKEMICGGWWPSRYPANHPRRR